MVDDKAVTYKGKAKTCGICQGKAKASDAACKNTNCETPMHTHGTCIREKIRLTGIVAIECSTCGRKSYYENKRPKLSNLGKKFLYVALWILVASIAPSTLLQTLFSEKPYQLLPITVLLNLILSTFIWFVVRPIVLGVSVLFCNICCCCCRRREEW